jgi:peptidyl-prolyl cis-trans isomerase B (cyclophilin B)
LQDILIFALTNKIALMKKYLHLLSLIFAIIFTSCGQNKENVVTIHTKYGDMVAILYDETPKHKENFLKLAESKYYDSLLFHRVIEGFMIQGGDPDSKRASADQPLGRGGPDYTIPAEIHEKFLHEKGALSAARLPDAQNPGKASSGSQFYIVQGKTFTEEELTFDNQRFGMAMQTYFMNPDNKPSYDSLMAFYEKNDREGYESYVEKIKPRVIQQTGINPAREISPERLQLYTTRGGAPHLDGGYTVFGKVIKGLDVIDKIAAQPKGMGDRPAEDIRMTVTVEKMSRKQVEKQYGYRYPEVNH